MEIGPIPGIRAIGVPKALRAESVVPASSRIEATLRTGDETYSSNRQTPERGLEGEESDTVESEDAEEALRAVASGAGKVDLIA